MTETNFQSLSFSVVYQTSQLPEFLAASLNQSKKELNTNSKDKGWRTRQDSPFPHELIIKIGKGVCFVDSVSLLAHQSLVPKKVNVYVACPSVSQSDINTEEWKSLKYLRIGHFSFSNGKDSNFTKMELKSIRIRRKAKYIRLVFLGCYENELNPYRQISLIGVRVHGFAVKKNQNERLANEFEDISKELVKSDSNFERCEKLNQANQIILATLNNIFQRKNEMKQTEKAKSEIVSELTNLQNNAMTLIATIVKKKAAHSSLEFQNKDKSLNKVQKSLSDLSLEKNENTNMNSSSEIKNPYLEYQERPIRVIDSHENLFSPKKINELIAKQSIENSQLFSMKEEPNKGEQERENSESLFPENTTNNKQVELTFSFNQDDIPLSSSLDDSLTAKILFGDQNVTRLSSSYRVDREQSLNAVKDFVVVCTNDTLSNSAENTNITLIRKEPIILFKGISFVVNKLLSESIPQLFVSLLAVIELAIEKFYEFVFSNKELVYQKFAMLISELTSKRISESNIKIREQSKSLLTLLGNIFFSRICFSLATHFTNQSPRNLLERINVLSDVLDKRDQFSFKNTYFAFFVYIITHSNPEVKSNAIKLIVKIRDLTNDTKVFNSFCKQLDPRTANLIRPEEPLEKIENVDKKPNSQNLIRKANINESLNSPQLQKEILSKDELKQKNNVIPGKTGIPIPKSIKLNREEEFKPKLSQIVNNEENPSFLVERADESFESTETVSENSFESDFEVEQENVKEENKSKRSTEMQLKKRIENILNISDQDYTEQLSKHQELPISPIIVEQNQKSSMNTSKNEIKTELKLEMESTPTKASQKTNQSKGYPKTPNSFESESESDFEEDEEENGGIEKGDEEEVEEEEDSFEESENLCPFCGWEGIDLSDEDLRYDHFGYVCPMMTECVCGQIIEVSTAQEHYLAECFDLRVKNAPVCQKCKQIVLLDLTEAQLDSNKLSHDEIKQAVQKALKAHRCPGSPPKGTAICMLCAKFVKTTDWRTHLCKECPNNERKLK